MTNAIQKLTESTPDKVLAYIAAISNDLSPQEQLEQLNRMLAILSDLKACESFIQGRKNELMSEIHSNRVEVPIVPLKIAYSKEDELLSVPEIAKRLGCTRQTVYNSHFKNGLKYIQPTGPRGNKKIKRSDFEKYLEGIE